MRLKKRLDLPPLLESRAQTTVSVEDQYSFAGSMGSECVKLDIPRIPGIGGDFRHFGLPKQAIFGHLGARAHLPHTVVRATAYAAVKSGAYLGGFLMNRPILGLSRLRALFFPEQ